MAEQSAAAMELALRRLPKSVLFKAAVGMPYRAQSKKAEIIEWLVKYYPEIARDVILRAIVEEENHAQD